MRKHAGWSALTCAVALILVHGATAVACAQDFPQTEDHQHLWNGHSEWPTAGQNLGNTRSQPSEHILNRRNVSGLYPKWIFTAGSNVSATPTVAGDLVYFPDWAENIFAVDRSTGKQVWSKTIPDYTGIAGDLSRVSPTVFEDELIFGDNQTKLVGPHHGAYLIAVNRFTGELRWITQIESHPAAIITGSALVYNGVVYQGVSSSEEGLATSASYPCCTFRGSVVAVDAKTGHILWQTYDVPDNQGATNQYSGGAIWQPPVIDPVRGLLYVGTGNNYTAPASVRACQTANPQATNCPAPDDHFDSALAFDLSTGAIRWSQRLWGYDVVTLACGNPPGVNCEKPVGPDYDMSSGGNLLPGLVGFGQKSGIYWALDPDTGAITWATMVGPGGPLGGIEWGTATDGKRIYVANANSDSASHTLPSGQTITWGWWSAVDPTCGKVLWETADPTKGAFDVGSVSVANGVMYAGSFSGQLYALDTTTGEILWSYQSGGSIINGPAIADGVLYWGSGSPNGGTNNNKVFAFAVPPSTIDFSNGFAQAQGSVQINGNAALDDTLLQLTTGRQSEAGSAFYAQKVNVQSFTTDFVFQLVNPGADGMTFTIQNAGPNALGGVGGSLGYAGIPKSVAVKFDLYNNEGEGPNSTGLYVGGVLPATPAVNLTGTGIDLHSGDPLSAHITYDGVELTLTVTDTDTQAKWSHAFAIDIPSAVDGTTAYLGFTGATGGLTSSNQVLTWTYLAGAPLP